MCEHCKLPSWWTSKLVCQLNPLHEIGFTFYRWVCIYPAYINSKKSRQEGRKVRKDLCVENPTFQEIKDVLSVSNLRIGIENKLYPRERSKVNLCLHSICSFSSIHLVTQLIFNRFHSIFIRKELTHRGRIRVQLRNDDGTPFNPEFPTRESILFHLGTKIPMLKSRQSARSSESSESQQKSAGGGNKKGKGKRR